MRSIGRRGEDDAVSYLLRKGYEVLHRNYRTPLGEVDVVARDRETIVFVEVKARSSEVFGQPFEAVDLKKQERIRRIALFFLKHRGVDLPVRFEVISLLYRGGRCEVTHMVDTFGS